MATVYIRTTKVSAYNERNRQSVAVRNSQVEDSDEVTSSGTSQQSSVLGDVGEVWNIRSEGGAVWVAFGANPTAVVDSSMWLIKDGEERDFAVTANNEKCAVIDDA